MKEVRFWFKWFFVILPVHGVEQFLFGIDELYELKGQMGTVLGLFPNPDYGIVLLVFVVVLLVMSFVYGFLIAGKWWLLGPGFFAVSALVESHHIVKTIMRGSYFPGAVTAIPFVMIGVFLLRAVIRELRSSSGAELVEMAATAARHHPELDL